MTNTKELAMSREEYRAVMQEIWKNHRFANSHWDDEEKEKRNKHIKYVRPNWDMRDGRCFSVTFNGLGCHVEGINFNSGYGQTVTLFDQIMNWLNTPKEELQEDKRHGEI